MKKTLGIILALTLAVLGQEPFDGRMDPFGDKKLTEAGLVKKDFRVSLVGKVGAMEKREQFIKLWELIQANPDGTEKTIYIRQALKPVGKFFLYTARFLTDNETIAVLLKDRELLEGAKVTVVLVRDGVFDGENLLGAAIRHPRYKEEAGVAPTKEEFIDRLKMGEVYQAKEILKGGCHKCVGKGEMGLLQKRAACSTCGGSGDALVVWTLKW